MKYEKETAGFNKKLQSYSQGSAKNVKAGSVIWQYSKQSMYSRSAVNISCNLQGIVICRFMAGKDSISVLPKKEQAKATI
jgi:hypothetical protein